MTYLRFKNLLQQWEQIKPWLPFLFIMGIPGTARFISLPGLENRLAWDPYDDNPLFYAYRFADNALFPNSVDVWGGYARHVMPFVSVVNLIPTLFWWLARIDPLYIAYIEVFLMDFLLALMIYRFSQLLFHHQLISLLATVLGLSARVTNWNLANYGYLGSHRPYAGDMILPFNLLVLILLLQQRMKWALVLTGALSFIHPAQAISMIVVVSFYLLVSHREYDWRSLANWILISLGLLLIGLLPGFYLSSFVIKEPMSREQWLTLAKHNHHIIPWSGWWGWQWFIRFVKWSLLGVLSLRVFFNLEPYPRRILYAVGSATLLLSTVALVSIWLQIPMLMKIGFFRISILFNLAALPLVAAYFFHKIREGTFWTRALAVATILTMGMFHQSPPWLLLLALIASDLAEGRLAFWSVSLQPGWRWGLNGLGQFLLLIVFANVCLAYWYPSGVPGVEVLNFFNWFLERTPASPLVGSWLLVFMGALVGSWLLSQWKFGQPSFITLPIILIAGLVWPIFNEAQTIGETQCSERYRAWKATQDWARQHTPLSAMFIGFPMGNFPQAWRTFSHRNLVDLAYRGNSIYISDQRLHEYNNLAVTLLGLDPNAITSRLQLSIDMQQRYRGFTNRDFLRIAAETGADYALIQKPRTLGFQIAYENDYFLVYDLEQPLYREVEYSLVVPNGDFEVPTNDGLVPYWSGQGVKVDLSKDAYKGQQAIRISMMTSDDQVAWFFSGAGELLKPPTEGVYQVVPDSLYRIRSQVRGDAWCRRLTFWAIEFDQTGQSQITYLDRQYFLDQRYLVNPHVYVQQVAFFKPQPTTVSFRFAFRLQRNPDGKDCQLEIDQVEMSRFETITLQAGQ